MSQLAFTDVEHEDCPLYEFVDPGDLRCNIQGWEKPDGYEVYSCDSPSLMPTLAAIHGVGFDDIKPLPIEFSMPTGYVPMVTHGSGKLFGTTYKPNVVAVNIGELVSPKQLRVKPSAHRTLNIPDDTEVFLLGYGLDALLETIWPRQRAIYQALHQSGIAGATSLNFSMWHNQPHAEHLINSKRSLVSYSIMQQVGIPAAPHLYWAGSKSLSRWAEWLNYYPEVMSVAICLETITGDDEWRNMMADLRELIRQLALPPHFIVTGPSVPNRIREVASILPSLTITNNRAAQAAWARQYLIIKGDAIEEHHADDPPELIMAHNVAIFEQLVSSSLVASVATKDDGNITTPSTHIWLKLTEHMGQCRTEESELR